MTAVPWKSANASLQGDELTVGLQKDKLESAPTFSNWDEFKQGDYEQQVRSYYEGGAGGTGMRPGSMEKSPTPGSEPGTMRGSEPGTGSGSQK